MASAIAPHEPFRIVMVDGHSRAGKTWHVVAAICQLLDEHRIDVVLSTGEDSHRVFAGSVLADSVETGECKDLLTGFELVAKDLRALAPSAVAPDLRPKRVVLLLDDFLGSVSIRTLTNGGAEDKLLRYLSGEASANPLAAALERTGGVVMSVVFTARSSVLVAARMLLAWEKAVQGTGPRGRLACGVFEDHEGFVGGVMEADWYARILRKYSRLTKKHKHLRLPALAAFAEGPRDAAQESELAEVLFGSDLEVFAAELRHALDMLPAGDATLREPAAAEVARDLEDAYLLYLAPGLAFPDRSTDASFWRGGRAEELRNLLYLSPSHTGGPFLRVPNRFYLRAVAQHLEDDSRRDLVARVLLLRREEFGADAYVLVRGLIEWALEYAGGSRGGESQPARLRKALHTAVDEMRHPLLGWELALLEGNAEALDAKEILRKPGLASAVGWVLSKLESWLGDGAAARREKLLQSVARALNEILADGGGSNDGANDAITVSYSNLLRWVVPADERPGASSYLCLLADAIGHRPATVSGAGSEPSSLNEKLHMVLEDALIWADSYEDPKRRRVADLANLPQAWSLIDELKDNVERHTQGADWRIVNRAFSMAWHNEWMEHKGHLGTHLAAWSKRHMKMALQVLAGDPSLLDDNLVYHWTHMIAQCAVWRRDWCLSRDSISYERRTRFTSGCSKHADNALIGEILLDVMEKTTAAGAKDRIRNALFLFCARAATLPEANGRIAAILDERGASAKDAAERAENVLQAIFELGRQGFLGVMERNEAKALTVRSAWLPRQLEADLQHFWRLHRIRLEPAWTSYRKDLERVSCLDLLPSHWEQIIPADWYS